MTFLLHMKHIFKKIPFFCLQVNAFSRNTQVLTVKSMFIVYLPLILKLSLIFKNIVLYEITSFETPMMSTKNKIKFERIISYMLKESTNFIFILVHLKNNIVSSVER